MVLVQLPPSMWKRPSSARNCLITSASRSGPSPGTILSVGNLGDQWGYLFAGEIQPRQTLGLRVRLHLADQLRVTALGLDHRRDGRGVASSIRADEAMREMAVLRR